MSEVYCTCRVSRSETVMGHEKDCPIFAYHYRDDNTPLPPIKDYVNHATQEAAMKNICTCGGSTHDNIANHAPAHLDGCPWLAYNRDRMQEALDRKAVEAINHPAHYGGDTVYETIKVIRAWGLDRNFCLANAVKYLSRAGKKDPVKLIEDLRKAAWYIADEIKHLEGGDK